MNNNSGNHFYPFPVLGNKKSIGGVFELVKPAFQQSGGTINISGTLKCDNISIIDLCKAGDAEAFGHIECIKTSFRTAYKSKKWSNNNESEFECSIDSKLLRGNTELGFFIVTTKELENYFPQKLDPLYGKTKFNLPQKAIIAISKRLFLNIDEEFIQSASSSIFIFDKGVDTKLVYWDFDRNDGKIGIMVPQEELNTIRNLRTNELFIRTTIVSYILPALAQALKLIFSNDEYGWKTPLKAILDRDRVDINSSTDIDETYKIAQMLLRKRDAQESVFGVMLQEILNPSL
jgi:hypothetical protein